MNLKSYWILDSRGNPTVEVCLTFNGTVIRASAPSGASKSFKEKAECRDNDKSFHGKGVLCAIKEIEGIKEKLLSTPFEEWDFLIENLPTNASTPLSIISWKARALKQNVKLFQLFSKELKTKPSIPFFFSNMVNGGMHSGAGLSIQEFMFVVKKKSISESIKTLSELYISLKNNLTKKYGKNSINVGDEGGFTPPITLTEDVLEIMELSAEEIGEKPLFALDAAANSFFDEKNNIYLLDGKQFSAEELLEFYKELLTSFNIYSIEDPFSETHPKFYKELNKHTRVVADDLTATNAELIKRYKENASALLLKINQAGTISKALEAYREAKKHKWDVIVSHRSGETEETIISHLAYAIGEGLKAGAPARGERTIKYNELIRMEMEAC